MRVCPECGITILKHFKICPRCGLQLRVGGDVIADNEASSWWYLVPLFFSILGGIIAYAAIKDDDIDKANGCLFLGFIIFVLNLFMLAQVL